jgi:MFS family permease
MENENYLTFLLFFCPLLNLLCGVSLDLYAPSIVDISHYMNTSLSMSQNTITATIFGYAIGQLFFGAVGQKLSHKQSINIALIIFTVSSAISTILHNIMLLLIFRSIQGFSSGSFAVNARSLLASNFKKEKLTIAILYLSIAWGIGPIISPYIGGTLAKYFGWKASFAALCMYSSILILAAMKINNCQNIANTSPTKCFPAYCRILSNKRFLLATLILAMGLCSGLVFNIVGAAMVKILLNLDAYTFGKFALLIGGGYLLGNLTNRILITYLPSENIMNLGFLLYFICLIPMYITAKLSLLLGSISAIFFINFSVGFIFPNIMAICISTYQEFPSICAAAQGFMMLLFSSIASYIISIYNITTTLKLFGTFATIYSIMLISYILLFYMQNLTKIKLKIK